ncbi:uncharacterized protein LOC128954478 [Oppia nitens]|uniref:uncharacterized protein LOC128954478 n=1 Tax=Oppia nitens TaxID=1686743 RepID=UPI0023DA7546|nr:uncharacterized protein LOC128954478 [Oppia nitens]
MLKNQLTIVLLTVFTMQFSVSYQDSKQPVKFDFVGMYRRNGFNTIDKSLLQEMSKELNQFYDGFRKAPADDLLFIIRDDFGSTISAYAVAVDIFQKEFTKKNIPSVAKTLKLVAGLLKQIDQTLNKTITPLIGQTKRKGKPLVNKSNFVSVNKKLAIETIKRLKLPQEAPKLVSTVFVEIIQTTGRATNQAIQSILDKTKVLGVLPAKYLPIQAVSQTLDVLLQKIADTLKMAKL